MRIKLTTINLISILILFFSVASFAQPELDLKPDRIEFEDLFNRIAHTNLVNKGNEILTIDSIKYKEDNYIVEFENGLTLPFTIVPDDSITMNVTLSSYYNITLSDTSDTMFIYNNGIESVENLKVRIRFFEDDFGIIEGTVRDTLLTPLENAKVYFLYNGIYLLNYVMTDQSGFYQANLPEGEYTVAAEKEEFYTLFHDSTYDPFYANFVEVDSGAVNTIDYILRNVEDTSYFLAGDIYDSLNSKLLDKGVVIIRRGQHVPHQAPLGGNVYDDTLDVVSGFLKPDGTFKIYCQLPRYYYVQAYTNYFLPGYYNDEGNASVYWQNADSILIDTSITDKNIYLLRDSSYGGGDALGNISFNFGRSQDLYSGITLLARSLTTDALYSYNFGKDDGTFKITNLPYGQYELIAQKIGIDDAYSQIITIDPSNPTISGINIVFNISDVESELTQPDMFTIYPNYPNPFNPTTTISFYTPGTADINISVMNILGEKVSTLADNSFQAGFHKLNFDASRLSTGVYFILFKSNQIFQTQKILLLK